MSAELTGIPKLVPKRVAALQSQPARSLEAEPSTLAPGRAEPIHICLSERPSGWDVRLAGYCRGSWSWLTSMAIHAVLILALGLLTVFARDDDGPQILIVDSDSLDEVDASPRIVADAITLDVSAAGSESASWEISVPIPAPGEIVAPISLVGTKPAGRESDVGAHNGPTAEVDALLKHGGNAVADQDAGAGETEKGNDAGQAQFFGIQASGNNFVFVVDSSSSMTGAKWTRACREMLDSIERLGPEQTFGVFFFDGNAHLMFNQTPEELALLSPTEANITKLRRWMVSIEHGNSTRPLSSLRLALAMKPDAVFLLSDGEFQDETPAYLRVANLDRDGKDKIRPKTVIHTVCFKSVAGAGTLKSIADENGGTYRFVK